jgi:amino acid adenylation domain-containing protein
MTQNNFYTSIIKPFVSNLNNNSEKNAFCIDEVFFTYGNLKEEINKIRAELQKINNHNSPIGLITHDDLTTYASIWAIWFEGFSYVPLHPKQPLERNLEIIHLANCNLILNSKKESFSTNIPTILTSELQSNQKDFEIKDLPDSNNAYILFTSGSTGKPKGVPISRSNLAAFVESFMSVGFDLSQNDRFLQCFDLTFDVSVQCFVIPLITGASVYTIPHHAIKYSYVYGLLEDHQLTFATMAPSMVRFLQPYFDELDLPNLKYNILTAEASVTTLINEWVKCIPNAKIFNFYGPTEATIYCTFYNYKPNKFNPETNGILTIGKPMSGITAILIDENDEFISGNEKGELCVSGNQVTSGYLTDPEKNKTAFITKKIGDKEQIFYRTGDICFMEGGQLMYVGRADHQVKIQGYRVELSEIEFHAREALQGKNAIAVAFLNQSQSNEIALFIEDVKLDEQNIKNHLKLKLPSYMIPSKFIIHKEFPLNANGKIDRKSLSLELSK